MKKLLTGFILLSSFTVVEQSPYLGVNVKMDPAKTETKRYKIEMKICEPIKRTDKGGWFTHDTSAIDFASLKVDDINCGEYFDNGMPTPIAGPDEKPIFNQFKFSNQVFAWEKLFVFKISDASSRGWHPEMYIIIPMKYKSFVTYIDIVDIEFLSGKVVFLNELNASYGKSNLSIRHSLKNAKTVEVKGFSLEKILESK